jgi:hypothetical protein
LFSIDLYLRVQQFPNMTAKSYHDDVVIIEASKVFFCLMYKV